MNGSFGPYEARFPRERNKMGSRVMDLPMKFLMPTSFDNIKEISIKTVPSVTKVEIKKVMESMYGFEVEKVKTLNMQDKKKRRGNGLISRPNYKKAYVTLKKPISIFSDQDLFRSMEKDTRITDAESSLGNFESLSFR